MPDPVTTVKVHDPDDVLDYAHDWTRELDAGETITASEWRVVGGTATIAADATDPGAVSSPGTVQGAAAIVWVLSATAGLVRLRNRITTSAGRQFDQTLTLRVEAR